MWKIYSSPGAGVAIVSNGARLGTALASISERLYLGAIRYVDPNLVEIGTRNTFDTLMVKRASYSYEREVRLVYWDTEDMYDPLANFKWNSSNRRFEDLIYDNRPLVLGRAFECDLDVLIERVIISPFAPAWYQPMIERLRDRLDLRFPVDVSKLLTVPLPVP